MNMKKEEIINHLVNTAHDIRLASQVGATHDDDEASILSLLKIVDKKISSWTSDDAMRVLLGVFGSDRVDALLAGQGTDLETQLWTRVLENPKHVMAHVGMYNGRDTPCRWGFAGLSAQSLKIMEDSGVDLQSCVDTQVKAKTAWLCAHMMLVDESTWYENLWTSELPTWPHPFLVWLHDLGTRTHSLMLPNAMSQQGLGLAASGLQQLVTKPNTHQPNRLLKMMAPDPRVWLALLLHPERNANDPMPVGTPTGLTLPAHITAHQNMMIRKMMSKHTDKITTEALLTLPSQEGWNLVNRLSQNEHPTP